MEPSREAAFVLPEAMLAEVGALVEAGYADTEAVTTEPLEPEAALDSPTWYAAHIVVLFQYMDGDQSDFPLWENILLIQARGWAQAWEVAKREGVERYHDDEAERGATTCNGRPARQVYIGVRKLVECFLDDVGDSLGHGTEVSWLEMEVASQSELDALMHGGSVRPLFEELEVKAARSRLEEMLERAQRVRDEGHYAKAERLSRAALKRARRLGAEVYEALNELAQVYHATGRTGEAEQFFKRGLALAPPRSKPRARLLEAYSALLRDLGRSQEALQALEENLELRKAVGYRPAVAQALQKLATARRESGQADVAEALTREALAYQDPP